MLKSLLISCALFFALPIQTQAGNDGPFPLTAASGMWENVTSARLEIVRGRFIQQINAVEVVVRIYAGTKLHSTGRVIHSVTDSTLLVPMTDFSGVQYILAIKPIYRSSAVDPTLMDFNLSVFAYYGNGHESEVKVFSRSKAQR